MLHRKRALRLLYTRREKVFRVRAEERKPMSGFRDEMLDFSIERTFMQMRGFQ